MIPTAEFVEAREKRISRSDFFRLIRTSKSVLACRPFDSHGRVREKTNFAIRNSFFSRFSDLKKRSGIIFGAPFDSRGRVCRNARKTNFAVRNSIVFARDVRRSF